MVNLPKAAIEVTIRDTGVYSGFPWPGLLSNGTIVTVWKESSTHADAGAMMFGKSIDGGATWDIRQIILNGLPLQCSNLSLEVMPGDRIIISHQPNSKTSLSFAYSDDAGATWKPAKGGYTYPSGYSSAQFSKPIRLPSGKIIQPYYSYPITPGYPSIAGYIQSTDNGATWSHGGIIAQREPINKNPQGDAYTNGYGLTSEPWVAIIDTGATDANTKLAVFLRNQEYTGWSHYKSPDGGITWIRDKTYLFNKFAEGVIDKFPVTFIKHKGLFYIFAGSRKRDDYHISYVTCTPEDLYNNNAAGYSAEIRVQSLNADQNGSSYDCGYPVPFHDYFGNLVLQWYDTSPSYNGVGLRKTIIYQKPVTN